MGEAHCVMQGADGEIVAALSAGIRQLVFGELIYLFPVAGKAGWGCVCGMKQDFL